MIRTIRTRVFLGILLLASFSMTTSWLINTLFAEDFYLHNKRQKLLTVMEEIAGLFTGNQVSDILTLERIRFSKGVQISLFNREGSLVFDSMIPKVFPDDDKNGLHGQFLPPYFLPLPPGWDSDVPAAAGRNPLIIERFDEMMKMKFLECFKRLASGYTLKLAVPIAPIEESAHLSNVLALFSGLASLLVGSVLALLFAHGFAKPIIELKTIAEHMSNLDFSRKYCSRRQDEVGELGRSTNILSAKLHEAIERLKEDIRQERRLETLRRNFISSVSHELKTPITLIQGYAEGLRSHIVQGTQAQDEYCAIIVDECRKMDRLIRDLLDLSMLDSGSFSITREPFDLACLVERVTLNFRPLFVEQKVRFREDIAVRPVVKADPVRIEQVLVNYLSNALHHLDGKREIRISIACRDDTVRVSVYNSGKTIPDRELPHIWLSFYKVERARTREKKGTGLGLSIVRSIMDLHGGAYGVVNREEGVEFWFELGEIRLSAAGL